jgi:hypothetical protein
MLRVVLIFDLREGGGLVDPSNNRATVQPLRQWKDFELLGHRIADNQLRWSTSPMFQIAKHAAANCLVNAAGDCRCPVGAPPRSAFASQPDVQRRSARRQPSPLRGSPA